MQVSIKTKDNKIISLNIEKFDNVVVSEKFIAPNEFEIINSYNLCDGVEGTVFEKQQFSEKRNEQESLKHLLNREIVSNNLQLKQIKFPSFESLKRKTERENLMKNVLFQIKQREKQFDIQLQIQNLQQQLKDLNKNNYNDNDDSNFKYSGYLLNPKYKNSVLLQEIHSFKFSNNNNNNQQDSNENMKKNLCKEIRSFKFANQQEDIIFEKPKNSIKQNLCKEIRSFKFAQQQDKDDRDSNCEFKNTLLKLEDMGFLDRNLTIQFLVQNKGDLLKTVTDLLNV